MNRKREKRKHRILLCGGAALEEGANAWQDLLNLQMLTRLKKSGFDPEGGSVWICKMVCDKQDADGIMERTKKEKSLLVLKKENARDKVISRRLLRNRVISQMEVFLVCGSRMLTFLIDLNADYFEILKDQEACEAVDLFWKDRKEK